MVSIQSIFGPMMAGANISTIHFIYHPGRIQSLQSSPPKVPSPDGSNNWFVTGPVPVSLAVLDTGSGLTRAQRYLVTIGKLMAIYPMNIHYRLISNRLIMPAVQLLHLSVGTSHANFYMEPLVAARIWYVSQTVTTISEA